LPPRVGGSDAGAGVALRQSMQVLRPGGQGVAAGAVPADHYVIDVERPGSPPAGPMAEQAGPIARPLDCSRALFALGMLAAGASLISFVISLRARSPSDRLGAAVSALLCFTASVASCGASRSASRGALIVPRWRGSRPATPATWSNQATERDRPEAPQALAERRPDLHGLSLGDALARWGAPFGALGPATAPFNWNAPNLFVDDSGADRTPEVSHMLTRALVEYEGQDARFRVGVGMFFNQLATNPALRSDLADLSVEANGRCTDRIGVRLGELLLSQSLREVRDPAVAPRDVVLTLVLHAATQAMKKLMEKLMAHRLRAGVAPSADLLLAGFHAMQSTLQQHGIAVPTLFPADDRRDESDLWALRRTLAPGALAIVQGYGLDLAAGAGTSRARAASAGDGLALLLRVHGGRACDEILAGRLDHLRQPVLADWHQKLAAGADGEGYGLALDQAYGRALVGALCDDLADWEPQAAVPGQTG